MENKTGAIFNLDEEISLEKLVDMTRCFIDLADELYAKGTISVEEYQELTFVKKSFLQEIEKENII